jgi:hypothetical protein
MEIGEKETPIRGRKLMMSSLKSRIRNLVLHPMLALHPPPVKGRYKSRMSVFNGAFWRFVAPDQGSVRETWLFRRQGKRPRVQATLFY